jgi:hypothetical protein
MQNDDSIQVEATIDDDGFPSVAVAFEGHVEIKTVAVIRDFAFALFNAAAIAENEAAVYFGMKDLEKPQGFSKPKSDPVSLTALRLVRSFRPEFTDGIQVILGFNSREPIVSFPWPSRNNGLQFDLTGIRTHANQLIQAAEAAETDSFLRHFMQWKIESTPDEAQAMVMEFREFRSC